MACCEPFYFLLYQISFIRYVISSAECYNVLCPFFKKNEYYIPLELESNVLSP